MKAKLFAWLISVQKYIYIILGFLCLLLIVFIKGCSYGKQHKKCPIVASETIIKHDTVIHRIPDYVPYYIHGKDSIIYRDIPAKVDTVFILKDYFAVHKYDRLWRDSLLEVTLRDYISENEPVYNDFSYKILRPQTIIYNTQDNSIHYAKYTYFGVGLPVYPFKANRDISNINYINLEIIHAFPKGYVRAYWQPYVEQFGISAGIKILKFK